MKTKIVVIGAGSASFGPAIVSDMLQSKALAGSTIALCDKNRARPGADPPSPSASTASGTPA